MKHSLRGFSLVELLVAVAVTMLLAGISFAGWRRAVTAAQSSTCLTNLRVIGIAAAQYGAENDNGLPGTAHQRSSWIGTLQPYLGTKKPYRCPLDANRRRVASYALNDALATPGFSRRTNIPRPSQTMLMAETTDHFEGGDHFHFIDEETGEIIGGQAAGQFAADRHGGGSNFLFVDGHVETLTKSDLARRLSAPGSAFLQPAP